MRGSLRLLFFSALVLPPIIVAAVLTVVTMELFRDDKERYVYDLSSQSVDLVARNLLATLDGLRLRAELTPAEPPFLAVELASGGRVPPDAGAFRVENVSGAGQARLRVYARGGSGGLAMDLRPEALLDLRGYGGPTDLMVISDEGKILVHHDSKRVVARQDLSALLHRLRLFAPGSPRVGTRAVDLDGVPSLVAFARLPGGVAVLQSIPRKAVLAAADPLIRSAALASALAVVFAVFLALLVGRTIIRPLRLMADQAEAISRGEFGVATEARGGGEVATLMESLNAMSASLKKREQDLQRIQQDLLQAERLNTAGRLVASIVKEVSTPVEACFSLAGETLQRLPEKSDVRPLQERILFEADRAANILQNLSRLSTREEETTVRPVELDMAVADVLVSAGPLFERRKLSVETDLTTPAGKVVLSPDQLRNALLDILLFVAEEALPGSRVLLSVWKRGSEALVSIQYSGAPIPRDDAGRLLGSASGTWSKSALVFAVASLVLEEQGGRLVVEALENGNRLNVVLPEARG